MSKNFKITKRLITLIVVLIIIGLTIFFLESTKPSNFQTKQIQTQGQVTGELITGEVMQIGSRIGDQAPELIPGGDWFNSKPLTIAGLRGKVVMIDFWTYTCINCIRTIPYLRSWHDKYAKDGLVIIGIHTPEFNFERDVTNVRKAINDLNVSWPVMQDNNYATWNAFNNHYWPRKFLIDKDGKVRYDHIGEGGYEETEEMIMKLLKETGMQVSEKVELPTVEKEGLQPTTPEIYIGLSRGTFGNVATFFPGKYDFNDTTSYIRDRIYFVGTWELQPEFAQYSGSSDQKGELVLKYSAKKVNLVLKPKDGKGTFTLVQDGKLLDNSNKGTDVLLRGGNSVIDVTTARLYNLVNNSDYGQHELRIITNSSDFEMYAFTFG